MSVETVLWREDATAIADLVRQGEVTPVELADAAIARAEQTQPDINAIAERLYDRARDRARSIDRSLPLAGVPFAIKDLGIAIEGVPSHGGSRAPAFVPDFNSVLTERYLAAGLNPIATSTSPEYGLRLVTESAAFGITRNPWNTGHTPGGSSGGAAALVAAGVVPAAHASDGGGSIRVPSACCGLVGLKTSRGRVPLTPLASEAWYGFVVDHAVTRSVRDSALLLDLTHGPDALAPYPARAPKGKFRRRRGARPRPAQDRGLPRVASWPADLRRDAGGAGHCGRACPRRRPFGRGNRRLPSSDATSWPTSPSRWRRRLPARCASRGLASAARSSATSSAGRGCWRGSAKSIRPAKPMPRSNGLQKRRAGSSRRRPHTTRC